MLTAEWIFGWWNLVFLAPFLLALIYLGVYAASGVTFGDADADADLDSDADIDPHAELADAHAEIAAAGAHAEIAHESDLHAEGHTNGHGQAQGASGSGARGAGGSLFTGLTWLGLGRVPLSIVLMVLFFTWGAVGFATNVLARELFGDPGRLLALSLPAALAGSLVLTSAVSTLIVRLIPLNETSARRRHALLGSVGEAVFTIDEAGGMVMVRDAAGNLAQVAARVEPGNAPIGKGNKVRLVAYDGPRKLFFAQPNDARAAATAGDAAASK